MASHNRRISLLHLHIRRLRSNLDDFHTLLEESKHSFCDHLQKILTNATMENKLYFVTGGFSLNCLEFHQGSEIRQFFNNMFEKRTIPFINRPTRVATSSAKLIGNILTDCVFDTSLKNRTIKTSFSDHFAIFAAITLSNEKTRNQKIKIKKRFFSDKNKESSKQDLKNLY